MFGLAFGSFLNVCIYRMPRGLSVVRPRSACPACTAPIAAYDNIPVLSWLILGGKCRHCKAPISPRYVAVELLTGMFFVLSYLHARFMAQAVSHCGWEFFGPQITTLVAIKECVFSFLLIGLIFTDAETQLLPDLLTLPGALLGLAFSGFVAVDDPAGLLCRWETVDWHVLSLMNSLGGLAFGVFFILGTAMLYRAVRGVEGMGMGDVKLMAMIGAFLGFQLTLLVLAVGSMLGSVFGMLLIFRVFVRRLGRNRKRGHQAPSVARTKAWRSATLILRNFPIPFGVFLGSAALLAEFLGTPMIQWYMKFFR